MSKRSLALLCCSFLLAACQTTVLEDEDRVLPEGAGEFTSRPTEFDLSRSYVSFIGKSNIINHQGTFERFEAALTLDESDPDNLEAASITVAIDVTSVKTDAGVQDHLLREDFFDAEQFPEATFTSTSIESLGGDRYEITGELTIKGATETVTLNATITDLYMLVNYDLPRQTFGVGNDSYGDKLLETLVPVEAKLVFVEVE